MQSIMSDRILQQVFYISHNNLLHSLKTVYCGYKEFNEKFDCLIFFINVQCWVSATYIYYNSKIIKRVLRNKYIIVVV